jgi:hypothetical protein
MAIICSILSIILNKFMQRNSLKEMGTIQDKSKHKIHKVEQAKTHKTFYLKKPCPKVHHRLHSIRKILAVKVN